MHQPALQQVPERQAEQDAPADRAEQHPNCRCGVALDVGFGSAQIYNEEAFQYFLADERKRSQHSKRPFLLLLVDFEQPAWDRATSQSLLRGTFVRLSLFLRETDIVGWYREGRVVGAVLTEVANPMPRETQARIEDRIRALLHDELPAKCSGCLRVRVFSEPPMFETHDLAGLK